MLKTSMWAILGRPVNLRPPSLKTNWARQWVEGGHDWIFTIPQFSSFVNFHELSQANPHPRFPPQCMDCVRCMCFLIDVSSLLWECPLDSGKCSEQFFLNNNGIFFFVHLFSLLFPSGTLPLQKKTKNPTTMTWLIFFRTGDRSTTRTPVTS